jgi:addiction module RelE/StbE family toxin
MTIQFHRLFKKRYKKIPAKIQRQIDIRLRLFSQSQFHPLLNNHPLTGDRQGQWSINITGNWRAIYEFKNKNTVVFVDINTHNNLYR